MKLLSKKVKDYSDLNGLERLLYDTQEKQTLPDSYTYPTKKYERGMLISISNNRTYYEEIIKRYKEQYLTLDRISAAMKRQQLGPKGLLFQKLD